MQKGIAKQAVVPGSQSGYEYRKRFRGKCEL